MYPPPSRWGGGRCEIAGRTYSRRKTFRVCGRGGLTPQGGGGAAVAEAEGFVHFVCFLLLLNSDVLGIVSRIYNPQFVIVQARYIFVRGVCSKALMKWSELPKKSPRISKQPRLHKNHLTPPVSQPTSRAPPLSHFFYFTLINFQGWAFYLKSETHSTHDRHYALDKKVSTPRWRWSFDRTSPPLRESLFWIWELRWFDGKWG